MIRSVIALALVTLFLYECKPTIKKELPLPKLGRFEIVKNGDGVDTVFHQIEDFKFVDQDSNWVTNETFSKGIYIADFFFTTCPDICPKMKAQMLRVYDSIGSEPSLMFLSHTIDPKHDSVAVLKDFSERLGVDGAKWKFVTGDKEVIYKLGQTSYMASIADQGAAGLTHSGRFFLIDKNRHIRGAYNGTDAEEVNVMIGDIKKLLNEN